ncbi:MAG: GNAT family N-acetyltransferase [Candidatus Vogelbacteria bacterium]|nr:GNAT family N-acetyltransferase [Candidatus Vogelbacteria bacterium]
MLYPHTKRVFLSPATEENINLLWQWRNSNSFRGLCSNRQDTLSLEEFSQELVGDNKRDRHEQYIICRTKDKLPVGTIFSYNYNSTHGYLSVTTYINDRYVSHGYGVEAFLLFGAYLFLTYDLYKIYTEVYAYNENSLKIMLKAGFKEEGRFRGHRLHNGSRSDLIRLAFFQEDIGPQLEWLKKLGSYIEDCLS